MHDLISGVAPVFDVCRYMSTGHGCVHPHSLLVAHLAPLESFLLLGCSSGRLTCVACSLLFPVLPFLLSFFLKEGAREMLEMESVSLWCMCMGGSGNDPYILRMPCEVLDPHGQFLFGTNSR